jgi:hypothetical protein
VRGDMHADAIADFESDLARIPDPFAREARGALPAPLSRPDAPSSSRSRRRALNVAAACGAVLYEGVGLTYFKTRPDLGTASSTFVGLELALPIAVALVALVAVARRGRLGLGEPTARLGAWVLGALSIFAVATLAIFPHDPIDVGFWSRAQNCFLVTVCLGAGPLTLAALALRNTFAAAAGWRTAAVGVVSGALAASTIALICPEGDALHVLIAHGAIVLVMGAIGAMFVSHATRI